MKMGNTASPLRALSLLRRSRKRPVAEVGLGDIGKLAIGGTFRPGFRENSDMPTRNISLTPEQDAFVESVVKAGEYQNASEAVRDALRALQQRRREDALKLKALRVQIKAGVDALERGEFAEVDDVDLESYLESLAVESSTDTR
jgi:antitoxin ParD1/3/4